MSTEGTQHVVSFSGGVTSWAAGRLVRDRRMAAGDTLVLLFADTTMEAPDVYRFVTQAALREFRERIEARWTLPMEDDGGGCGCALETGEDE